MKGTVTKKDWLAVWQAFGFWKALRLLVSRNGTALNLLMS